MDQLLQGFGIILGVVAGTGVTLLTGWIKDQHGEGQRLRNLKFEFRLNIKKLDRWLEEITKYRNAVLGETLSMYFGQFDLSRAVFVTYNSMFWSGLQYKYLNYDDVEKLQLIISDLSLNMENWLNYQISQNKATFVKATASQQVDWWETKFKEHKKTLEDIVKALP